MMHRRNFWIVMACLFAACGSKNPGMSKEDAEKALSEQQTETKAPQSVAVTEFPGDYTPAAGIKYQPRIVHAGVVTLDIQAAMKNIRPVKASELGKLEVHRVGVEAYPRLIACSLLPIEENYLYIASEGLFLLDKDFRLIRQLFQNNVETADFGGVFIHQAIVTAYYDAQSDQLRCYYVAADNRERIQKTYLVALPWEEMLASHKLWKPENITSIFKVDGFFLHSNIFLGMEGGYVKSVPFTSRFYTHSLRGDTLCCFEVDDKEEYRPKGNIPNAEWCNAYIYQGKIRVRMSFDNTFYELTDASNLKAVYQLNFGAMRRPTGKEAVATPNADLTGTYSITRWFESTNHLFIRLGDYSALLYNKKTKEFCSLPLSGGEHPPLLEPDAKGGIAFFPHTVVDGIPVMYLRGKDMKEKYPEYVKSSKLTDISDNELFIMTVK